VELRFYQREAIDAVLAARDAHLRRVMIVLPTGAGKTVVMSALPRFLLRNPSDVTVIVVNRDELVEQTIEKLRRTDPTGNIGIEKASRFARGNERYVVASVQTLKGDRLNDFFNRFQRRIGLLQFDECHHAVSKGYKNIADRLFEERDDALLFGVTATPQRGDGVGLAAIYEKIVYSRDLRWAVQQGVLVRPRCYRIESHVALDKVATRMGDFAIDQLSQAVDTPDRNDIIVNAYRQHADGMRTLVFCTSVEHAKNLCAKFRLAGVNAEWASGKTAKLDRSDIVHRFRSGQTTVLVNCSLYVEGFDVPEVRVLINARPTQSQALLIQMVGRALRPLDLIARQLGTLQDADARTNLIAESEKPDAIILDVVDEMKARGIATIPTLWGLPPDFRLKGEFLDDVQKKVWGMREKRPEQFDKVVRLVDCDVALAEFAAWTPPKRDESVPMKSLFDWRCDGDESWSLDLPPAYCASYRDGTMIEDFTKRYLAYRPAGTSNEEGHGAAVRAIDFDPASFRIINESVHIRFDGSAFLVTLRSSRSADWRVLGSDPEKNEAFFRCEHWIENNRGDITSAISARAAWKKAPPKSKAIKELVGLGIPLSAVPKNAGDAFALASRIGRERGVEIDIEAFQMGDMAAAP
jgi:superfamily II DNA or RNA helicase